MTPPCCCQNDLQYSDPMEQSEPLIVHATGQQIYDALVAGAKRGYNRSTHDYSKYEQALQAHYEVVLDALRSADQRQQFLSRSKGEWRLALLPVYLVMFHEHINCEPSEIHARIALGRRSLAIFDIPLEHWELFKERDGQVAH